jgi:hypothetical protein
MGRRETPMKTGKQMGILALILVATSMSMILPARADEHGTAKTDDKLSTFWTLPKEDGKVTLVIAGQPEPVTVAVSDATLFGGICLDCNLPLEFKSGQAGKKCMVCGCAVSNAACIVGKPMKTSTWQNMLKMLPHGVGLVATFNDPGKPESGLKKLVVDLRTVLLPVIGLESQTPEQLLILVKPLGGTQAELIDGGKRLSVRLKSDWTVEREAKLEKALAKLNAKVAAPEEAKEAPKP